MLCAGLIKTVHLDTKEKFGRYIVYAIEQVFNKLPIEWWQEMRNEQVYGNIPTDENMVGDAIIGFVNCSRLRYRGDDIWSRNAPSPHYFVDEAFFFDKPIRVSRDNLAIFNDIELENEFTIHRIVNRQHPTDAYEELIVPVTDPNFKIAAAKGTLTLEVQGYLKDYLFDYNGNLMNFKKLVLNCGNRQKVFKFDGELQVELDDNDEPRMYHSITSKIGTDIRMYLNLKCHTPLIE